MLHNPKLLEIVQSNDFTMIWCKGDWTQKNSREMSRKYVYDQRIYRTITGFKLEYGYWLKDSKMLEKYYKHNELIMDYEQLIGHIKGMGSTMTIKKVV